MGNALYKTQLCQNMMKNEYCPKGDDCIFAHSFEEQRSSGSFTPAFGVVQVFHLAFTWRFLESERIECFPLWRVIMFSPIWPLFDVGLLAMNAMIWFSNFSLGSGSASQIQDCHVQIDAWGGYVREGIRVSLRPLGARETGWPKSGPKVQDRALQKLRGNRKLSKVSAVN